MKYHSARMNNSSISKTKRNYSKNWIAGFFDDHAKTNLPATIHERNVRRRDGMLTTGMAKSSYAGSINGMKTKLDSGIAPFMVDDLEKRYLKK